MKEMDEMKKIANKSMREASDEIDDLYERTKAKR